MKKLILSTFIFFLMAGQAFATDYNLWKNDMTNRNSTYTISHVTDSSGFKAKAVLTSGGALVKQGPWRMSLWDAYRALRLQLLNGEDLIPISTTTQRDALTGIVDGMKMWNTTSGRLEICNTGGTLWSSAAGAGAMKPAAFGEMIEDNSGGSTINVTSKLWDTAGVGNLDGNGIITYLNTANGDELKVGTDGAGIYLIHYSITFTNAGGNVTEAGIHKNGVQIGKLEDTHSGDSAEKRDLRGAGLVVLAANDLITLHVVSSTPSDVITVYHAHLIMNRLN